jgi:hypothetical protein
MKITDWEVGYEVCFYRDILKLYGHGVKEKMEDCIKYPREMFLKLDSID